MRTVTLTLSSKISEMNDSFSGFNLLKRLPWSGLLLEAMLCPWSVLPPETTLSVILAPAGNHVEVGDPRCHQLLWARELLLQWFRWLQTQQNDRRGSLP